VAAGYWLGITRSRILRVLSLLLSQRFHPWPHSVRASMLAAVLVYDLSGAWYCVGPPQSNACLQQSLVLVACEIEKRPSIVNLGAVSRPEGDPRTGATIVDAFLSDATRENHGRGTIGERAKPVDLGNTHSGSILGGPDRRDDVVADPFRVRTIMVRCGGFDAGRGARRRGSGRKISTHVDV